MAVICKNRFGYVMTIIDCDDMEEALSVARSWEKNNDGITEITIAEE